MSDRCCTPARDSARDAGTTSTAESSAAEHPGAECLPEGLELIELEGGTFLMGDDSEEIWSEDGEAPVREVTLSPFRISATTVTNAQFARFVDATGYKTEAERFGWSYVFLALLPKSKQRKLKDRTVQNLNWWYGVEGASWRKPEGPGSSIQKRLDHPVTHVSWSDAKAFVDWAGLRLPTEAEWEYAARGGLVRQHFPWGDELTPGGKHRCNIWQGKFPERNTEADGYLATAPARSYRPNGYGLYNMVGNVWEWCADWFHPSWHLTAERTNPQGPPGGSQRIMRGGSFLCHASYCNRYRNSARTGNTPDSSTANCGFRCAADV